MACNHFTDLSPWQERFITAASRTAEVLVALSYDSDVPATHGLEALVARLGERGNVVSVSTGDSWTDPGLAALTSSLFSGRSLGAAPQAVRFMLAAGEDAEAVLAAREARRLVETGVAPGQIAVTFRDLGRRVARLRSAFDAEGVAADFDVDTAFRSTPFGAALFAGFDAVTEGPDQRERLLAFLLSPYSGVPPADVARADARWRRSRVSGSALVAQARDLSATSARVLQLCAAVGGAGLSERRAQEWKELADTLLAAATSARGLGGFTGLQDAAAHRAVLSTVSELVGLQNVSVDGSRIRKALVAKRVATGARERSDAVVVTEVHRLRSRRFDAVIIGGLTADEFASEKPEPLAAVLLGELG
ncbi:MAG: hypothetical protein FDZ75_06885, partial [Actinobacteria bacterium]